MVGCIVVSMGLLWEQKVSTAQATQLNPIVTRSRHGILHEPINFGNLFEQGCSPAGHSDTSRFIVTGRGGLSTNPIEPLSSSVILVDTRLPMDWSGTSTAGELSTPSTQSVEETQRWTEDRQGNVVFATETPSSVIEVGCRLSSTTPN